MDTYFQNACSILDENIKEILLSLSDAVKCSVEEISLQKNRPLYLVTANGIRFVNSNAEVTNFCDATSVTVQDKCIENAVMRACGYTIFAHQREIERGYISFADGCRLAITGSSCSHTGIVADWKTVDSVSIRIARNIKLSVREIFKDREAVCSVLLAGPPSSGKTTWLRSIVYALANGAFGCYYRVSVIDEKNELFPHGIERPPALQVLNGASKEDGIARAVRLCAPDVIVCDEIATKAEVDRICDSVLSGILFICSMHARDFSELQQKEVFRALMRKNVFSKTVLLQGKQAPGKIAQIHEKVCL